MSVLFLTNHRALLSKNELVFFPVSINFDQRLEEIFAIPSLYTDKRMFSYFHFTSKVEAIKMIVKKTNCLLMVR